MIVSLYFRITKILLVGSSLKKQLMGFVWPYNKNTLNFKCDLDHDPNTKNNHDIFLLYLSIYSSW